MGMAEHFSNVRVYLMEALSAVAIVRHLRDLLTGRKSIADDTSAISADAFTKSVAAKSNKSAAVTPSKCGTRLAKLPIIMFLAVVFGIPWLMHRVIAVMEEKRRRRAISNATSGTGNASGAPFESTMATNDAAQQAMSSATPPPSIRFARALYDFQAQSPQEISLRAGDVVGVIQEPGVDVTTREWWRGKVRGGSVGWFPANHVALLEQTNDDASAASESGVSASIPTTPASMTMS